MNIKRVICIFIRYERHKVFYVYKRRKHKNLNVAGSAWENWVLSWVELFLPRYLSISWCYNVWWWGRIQPSRDVLMGQSDIGPCTRDLYCFMCAQKGFKKLKALTAPKNCVWIWLFGIFLALLSRNSNAGSGRVLL